MTDFTLTRRQQFLTENYYQQEIKTLQDAIQDFERSPAGSGDTVEEGWLISYRVAASLILDLLLLDYTAGNDIEPLRYQLEEVVVAYERYVKKLREETGDNNEMAFPIRSVDGYCPYIWIISLAFLLHRKDLLPRIANLVDGDDKENVGADFIIEDLLNYSDLIRYDTDTVLGVKPFMELAQALCTETNDEAIELLNKFLKKWYKDLAAAPWHDSHKAGGGYYGYWAFEAAATVLLLGIEDDSSLHQYLYYPKDIVAFAKTYQVPTNDISQSQVTRLRCEAGQPCPKTGNWYSYAYKQGKEQKHVEQGQTMPNIEENTFGATIWYMDEK